MFLLASSGSKIILLARMPGQRRLAISRLRVPNLDAFVDATAGNLFSIGTPRHRVDPVIVVVRTRINSNEGDKTNKKLTNPSARSASSCKPYILHFYIFSMYLSEKVTISSGLSHGHSQEHEILVFLFLACWLKKTYSFEWPVSVDWQSPDCESQILMVLSILPLAICFPSGLHATE